MAQSASSLVVQGNRRVEADTIRAYFRAGPDGRLDKFEIDQAIKDLYATGVFEDVRVIPGRPMVVKVVEYPVLNRVAFEGNKKIKDDQLAIEVQSKPRGTFSRPIVQADVQRIVELYRRGGRFDIEVTPKIISLPNGRVDLVFEIKEGRKIGVAAIHFVGNNSYSSFRLKEVIKTTRTGWFSFLQTTDIYDPDRVEADRELLRRFYLKRGFIDVRIISAVAEYDPARRGFIVTFTIDEGGRYRVGSVDVASDTPAIDPALVRSELKIGRGDFYNAEAVEKSIEDMTIEASRQGYPFGTVRPQANRDTVNKTVSLVFVLQDGPRIYIERINIRGNTRTRDYVIRREFDIAEGDAYNRALVNRAERRLKNLNFFKDVKITAEPGSAPDRAVLNVDVEEESTGSLSVAGGYSTADGLLGEVSISERNLLGRGQFVKASLQYGQNANGFELSFVEPYFLGYRFALGLDVFQKTQEATSSFSYKSVNRGGNIRFGIPLHENLSLQVRYSASQQSLTLPALANNCILSPNAPINGGGGVTPALEALLPGGGCYLDGEASLAIRSALAAGPALTSLIGYSLTFNTLDNNNSPTQGMLAELRQDFAGVGGSVRFIRSTVDVRKYNELLPDVVGLLHLQAGHIASWGGTPLRMLDHFQMGPNLVRGFAPAGIGPRDLTTSTLDALGGSLYWGASFEVQTPVYFLLPKDSGVSIAAFVDAGSLWGYNGPTAFPATGEVIVPTDSSAIRSSAGVSLIWKSPFGPLRFDYAFPLSKQGYDRVQQFRFGGGTTF